MISVITPTNNPRWLADAYESLKAQSFADWEWVLLLNNGCGSPGFSDPRVRIIRQDIDVDRIGALKYLACKQACGEIVVELDHDDLLMPRALARVAEAFAMYPAVGFVYSNCARVNEDGTPAPFGDGYGWEYRDHGLERIGDFAFQNTEVCSPSPDPQNLSRIWYAPDHLRAWRASEYWRIGGHDQSLKVADDHDLICRFYLQSNILHLDECLYVYRIHGGNSWLEHNGLIQEAQWRNYECYIGPIALKWARDNELGAIDLCGGIDGASGYTSVDISNGNVAANLEQTWPFEDGSIGVIRASDAVEHLRDPIHTMNEAYRVLAHGGFFLIEVPSTDGRGAFQDPTHVSFWNENSFWYYTRASHRRYIETVLSAGAPPRPDMEERPPTACAISPEQGVVSRPGRRPGATCRFQVLCLKTYMPGAWHAENNIPYVRAHLIAVKEGPRFHGALDI